MATTSPIIVSYFADRQDNNPRQGEATWEQLIEGLSKARPTACTEATCKHSECPYKDGPSWSTASYLAGTYRGKQNVASVSALVIDIDHIPTDEDLAEALETLDNYQYIIHSSHSDREGDHCVRVVVALSRPVQGSEWPRFWRAAMDTLKVPVDEQTKDASRLFYLPSRPADTWYMFDTNEGAVLDVDEVLANAPELPEIELNPIEALPDDQLPDADTQQKAADILAAVWPQEHGKHQAQLALAGALANAGWSTEAVAAFVTYVCEKSQPGNGMYDKRLQSARSSVEKARRGEAIRGWPSLKEFIGDEAVRMATDVLGLNTPPERDEGFALALLGMAVPPEAPVTHTAPLQVEITTALQAAAVARGSYENRLDANLLRHVVKGNHIISEQRELAMTAMAIVRAAPRGTTAEQIRNTLKPCTSSALMDDIDECVRLAMLHAFNLSAGQVAEGDQVEIEIEDEEPRDAREIIEGFKMNDNGTVKVCGINIARVLRFSSELRGRIRFNELTKTIEVIEGRFAGLAPNDLDVAVKNWLEDKWELYPPTTLVGEQLLHVARKYGSYDPVREYLESVTWDGKKRIGSSDAASWLTTYVGVEDTTYVRAVAKKFLISAVARAYKPGAKVDTVLILEGAQGARKSTVFAVLGGTWFTDTPLQMGDKDSRMLAASKWIVELAELASLSSRDTETIKAFLSSRQDDFRPPYGRAMESFPRRCVFGGTTNEVEYLQDRKNRRFWAVTVGDIDIHELDRDRDQLWAEAVEAFKAGEQWWLTPDEELLADEVISKRRTEDPWVNMILDWVRRQNMPSPGVQPGVMRTMWTLAEIARGVFDLDPKDMQRYSKSVCRALREAGFTNHGGTRRTRDGERGVYWSKEGEVLHEGPRDVSPAPQVEVEPGSN